MISQSVDSSTNKFLNKNLVTLKKHSKEDIKCYNSIFQKKTNESEKDFKGRIAIIKELLPQLPLWKNYPYENYIIIIYKYRC